MLQNFEKEQEGENIWNEVVSAGFNQFGHRLSKLNHQRREGSFHVGEEEEKDDIESDDD